MKLPFRQHHTLEILKGYEASDAVPLDVFMHSYFRTHKALGSKDRAAIAEQVYALLRWRGLIDYFIEKPATWEKRLERLPHLSPHDYMDRADIPLHVRVSFPKRLFDRICQAYGEAEAAAICRISNEPAPITLRVNTLKATREAVQAGWSDPSKIHPCQFSSQGLVVEDRSNFYTLPPFQQGWCDVQDEGSQLLASLVTPKPGDLILDYCAGAGGKALAIAPAMQGRGQIFLHDIRPRALAEAKRRLARAGIENAQVVMPDSTALLNMKKKFHWILLDVPCSGTGTLRRNPDIKWHFDETRIARLQKEQRAIFAAALEYLHPEGKIIYATCSLLNDENRDQVAYFTNTFPVEPVGLPMQLLPIAHGMDGFFGACFRRRKTAPSK